MTGKRVLVIDVDETLLNLEPVFFLKRFRKNYQDFEGRTVTFPDARHK